MRKAIVFSQFLEHAYLVSSALRRHKIKRAVYVRSMGREDRISSLRSFEHDPETAVLVTDRTGSLGHDFSFVSYIFLMEPIWDRSLEQQVVARAHRIGARETVRVEKLVAADSIESSMLEVGNQVAENSTRGDKAAAEQQRFRSILLGLRKVPTRELVDPEPSDETTYDIKEIGFGWFM